MAPFFSGETINLHNYTDSTTLKTLGLFQGTDKGFELDRKPTRVEGAVMLVRLLGKEKEAQTQSNPHPFKDVPKWADSAVGYMYANQLTSGISADAFGAGDELTANQFATFVLRALGYDDTKGDFSWREAINKLEEIGMINRTERSDLEKQSFLRGHIALLADHALRTKMKTKDAILAQQLIENGAISVENALAVGIEVKFDVQRLEQDELKGVQFVRPTYGSLHLYVRTEELDDRLSGYSKLAIKGFDNKEEFDRQSKLLDEGQFDFSQFLKEHEIVTYTKHPTKLYNYYNLIPGSYPVDSSFVEPPFYYVLVFYNAAGMPMVYAHDQLPFSNQLAESMVNLNYSSIQGIDNVKIAGELQIFEGITIEKTGETSSPYSPLPVKNFKMTVERDLLPPELKDRDDLYDLILYGGQPIHFLEHGVPKAYLKPHSIFMSGKFGGDSSFRYIVLVIFDSQSNEVAFYESENE